MFYGFKEPNSIDSAAGDENKQPSPSKKTKSKKKGIKSFNSIFSNKQKPSAQKKSKKEEKSSTEEKTEGEFFTNYITWIGLQWGIIWSFILRSTL